MSLNHQLMNRLYRDHHGIVVNFIRYEADSQKVIYRRPGYEWECAAPLLIFRARLRRLDK